MPSIRTTTAPTWSATARRAAEPLRAGAFALAVAVLELVLAHAAVGPEIPHYLFLFVGLFVVALVFRFPLATALVFFLLVDSVFTPTYFAHNVGALSVRPYEVALACLLALALVRPRQRTWGGPVGLALAIFLALVTISAALAVKSGSASLTEAFNWARPLSLLTFFYVVIRLFPSVEQRRLLLTGVAIMAACTGLVALLISTAGAFPSIAASARAALTGQEGAESIERVRLAGLSAGYALFWFCVVQVATRRGRARLGWSALLLGIAVDIALSFNRNMWLGLLVGAVLMAVLGGTFIRSRMAVGTAAMVAGVALLIAFGSATTQSSVVRPIVERGGTILNPVRTAHESSLEERASETSKAWPFAERHPLLGVGAGAPFGVYANHPVESGTLLVGVTVAPQLFLHNQYLYLVLISGLPGLIAFLFFLGSPLAAAVRRSPRDPAIAACGIGIALIMVSAVVAIYFTTEDMTAVLGLLTGVIVADRGSRAAAGEPSGLAP